MYSFDSRVRYSEVDYNSNMDLSRIIDYFQDCSSFQAEDLGDGVTTSLERGCAWLLNSWQIVVKRYPHFGEEITTSTWAYGFDAIYGYRNYLMKTKSGEVLAMANSNWIYVDLNQAHPLRLTEDITKVYPIEDKLDGFEYASRKIKLPQEYVEYEPITISLYQIDSNRHVNNGQYIKIAQQYIPDHFKIWQMRAEYKQQALLGDVLIPRVTLTDHVCTVALINKQGKPSCIIMFQSQDEVNL